MLNALTCLILAQFSQDLDPREYTSPSGQYVLRVDPSARDGSGPATYSLRSGGVEAWQRELPFTLRRAAVADDGTSAGCGEPATGYRAEGDFVVAILSPRGRVLFEERTERTAGAGLHSWPDPNPRGLFLQHELQRLIVRISDADNLSGSDTWWTYELEPPRLHSKIQPESLLEDPDAMGASLDARGVPGTPLTLAHWLLWDWPKIGARFVLHDEDYREVWRLDLPTDYQEPEEDSDVLDDVYDHGAILDSGPNRFELRFARDSQRVTFEVREDVEAATGWSVVESGRTEYVAPEPPPPAAIETLELALIERVALGESGSAEEPLVRDVVAFDVDADGGVRFVRRKKGEPAFTVVSLAADGTPTSTATHEPLPADVDENVRWEPLAGKDWLAIGSTWGFEEPGRSVAWRLDGTSGELLELAAFSADTVDAVEALPDGSFAVLATSRGSLVYKTLSVHGADGGELWSLTGYDVPNQVLLSPDDLAATASPGLLALVDNIRDTVEVFEVNGEHLRTLELAEHWPQEPNYPVGITPDVDGGVLVFDFNGDPPICRMSLSGEVRATLRPRFPDGSAPSVLARNLRLGGDGRLWTTDGSAFLRLDEEGVVDHHLGAPPGEQLERAGAMAIDHLGRVLIQDPRTGEVHVFDRRGARLFACTPDPTDYEHVGASNRLLVAGDGSLYVQRAPDYLVFGPDGARRGVHRFTGHPVFRPGAEEYWARHGQCVLRHDAAGEVELECSRHPDGNWLQVRDLDVDADGNAVVYDQPRDRRASLVVFDRAGDVRTTIELPDEVDGYFVRISKRWIAVHGYAPEATLVEIASGAVSRVTPGAPAESGYWRVGFSPDGSELWWVSQDAVELLRFALPAE